MKILIADDHELIRNGIKANLVNKEGIELVFEADNGEDALKGIVEHKPDVAILDINMPALTGLDVLSEINQRMLGVKVVVLSMYGDYQYIDKCLELGAKGYVAKNDAGNELLEALRWVQEGKIFFSSSVQTTVLENYAKTSQKKDHQHEEIKITNREKEVLKMVAKGLTSAQIADQLFVSPRTIDTHRANLMKKLEVRNAVELVIKARQLNLIS